MKVIIVNRLRVQVFLQLECKFYNTFYNQCFPVEVSCLSQTKKDLTAENYKEAFIKRRDGIRSDLVVRDFDFGDCDSDEELL